uniref:CHAT domain-containing protein n=1 Tax=Ascaris lumbricoides TaxID=6252 RepID=A0A0M3IGK8_ASCLU
MWIGGHLCRSQGVMVIADADEVLVLGTASSIDLQHKPQIERLLRAVRSEVHSLPIKNFSMNLILFLSEETDEVLVLGTASSIDLQHKPQIERLLRAVPSVVHSLPVKNFSMNLILFLSEVGLSGGLELGSQMSYISSCIDHGWVILVIDAWGNCLQKLMNIWERYVPGSSAQKIAIIACHCGGFLAENTWGNCLQKLMNIWERYAPGSSAQKIAIIACHCGGFLAENTLKSATECGRSRAVCLSDWMLSAVPSEAWWHMAIPRIRYWVPSARPSGAREKTRNGVRCASGGTKDPRKIPALAVGDMIGFIGEMFGNTSGDIVIPRSLQCA